VAPDFVKSLTNMLVSYFFESVNTVWPRSELIANDLEHFNHL